MATLSAVKLERLTEALRAYEMADVTAALMQLPKYSRVIFTGKQRYALDIACIAFGRLNTRTPGMDTLEWAVATLRDAGYID